MLLIILFTALGIMALVFICERFYKGLLGDEGYLMFTLPVTNTQHIAAKGITAMLLELITCVVAVISGILFLTVYDAHGFFEVLRNIPHYLGMVDFPRGTGWVIAEFIAAMIIGGAAEILQIYAAISLGHLAKDHRAGMSFLAYVVLNMALSVLMRLAAYIVDIIPGIRIELLFDEFSMGLFAGVIGVIIACELIKGAVFFFLSKYILDRKLNLE